MAQSYTRQSTFADGDTITAALFNDEYNQLLNAFAYSNTSAASTGHRHDGTAGEGGNIHTIGDLDFNNKIVVDSTNNRWGFYVEVSSAAVEQIRIQDGAMIPVTDSDVDLGTSSLYWKDAYIDSVTTTGNIAIGGNLTVTGNATISGNLTFGDADTDSITLTADVASSITPDTDDTYDLGSSTKEWRDIYIDGTAYLDAINFNGTAITATAAELNYLDITTLGTVEASKAVTADSNADVLFGDDDKLKFGSDSDLQVYYDSTNDYSYLHDTSTQLRLRGPIISLRSANDNVPYLTAASTGVTLTHGGSTKLVTNSSGIDVTGTAEMDTLSIGGTAVTSTATELNILDGVTATTAELNILNGVTATTAELNYTDGVTSNIQTQLDAKQALDSDLTAIAALSNTDGNFIVGNGTTWVVESGATARASLGLTISSDVLAYDANLQSFVTAFTLPTSDGTSGQALITNGSGTIAFGDVDALPTQTGNSGYYLTTDGTSASWDNLKASPTFTGTVTISSTDALTLPVGTTAQRPTAAQGMIRYNTTTSGFEGYNGSAWGALGAEFAYTRTSATATASQTTFSATYTVGYVDVYLNGVKLVSGTDFTATNGTSVVLTTGATVGDSVEILAYETFSVANALTAANNLSDLSSAATAITNLGITSTAAELNILDGVTSTAAELNILAGVTATTTELNYLDVTTLGATEASKAVTTDANGVVTFNDGISEKYEAVTSSSNSTSVDLQTSTNFSHTLTENTTFTFSNPASSGNVSSFTLKIVQDASASGYTVTWPSSVDWPSATAPTLTATASAIDYFVFITHDGGTNWYGFTAGQAFG